MIVATHLLAFVVGLALMLIVLRSWYRGAVGEVVSERHGQIMQGYDADHDDEHGRGELSFQAMELLAAYGSDEFGLKPPYEIKDEWRLIGNHKNQRRRLLMAAALVVAEIERRDRRLHRLNIGDR